jgi:NhaA family Na+:H+ antiporter
MKPSKIDILMTPINRFIKNEVAGGVVLMIFSVAAMLAANSFMSDWYFSIWKEKFTIAFGDYEVSKNLHHWVNDGLMSIFFFVIGLELKREIIGGELSEMRKAILPIGAAIGGMLFPAIIFLFFNPTGYESNGWGIPMATDIAFALGIMAILGKRVPLSLKIFLTAMAIADDIGAVLVIAFFYTSEIEFFNIFIGALFLGTMISLNLLGVRNTVVYAIIGIGGVWMAFLMSGVHATIAGVLAAMTIPAGKKIKNKRFIEKLKFNLSTFEKISPGSTSLISLEQLNLLNEIKNSIKMVETPLQRLEHRMHPFVAFLIIPIFAFANAGVRLDGDILAMLSSPVTMGIMTGLIAGKFLGVTLITKLLVKLRIAKLPEDVNWQQFYGAALLAGVGFTMSLFVTELAYRDADTALQAKTGILFASLIAGVLGYVLLFRAWNKKKDY